MANAPFFWIPSRASASAATSRHRSPLPEQDDGFALPAAALPDGAVILQACAACDPPLDNEFIAFDSDGTTRWRIDIPDGADTAEHARPSDEIPSDILPLPDTFVLVLRDVPADDPADDPIVVVDAGSGELIEVTTGTGAVAGIGFVAVLHQGGTADCQLEIFGADRSSRYELDGDCQGMRSHLKATGPNVSFESAAGTTVVNAESGTVTRFGPDDGYVVTESGVIGSSESGTKFGTNIDANFPFRLGPEWTPSSFGGESLVAVRRLASSNPFVAEKLYEVAVFDPLRGSRCAATRLKGESPTTVALADCQAIVFDEHTGTTYIVGSR